MSHLPRVLLWPVISLLITGSLHFMLEAIWPDLKSTFSPPVLAPLFLAYGAWVGSRSIELGGSYAEAISAGAILGLLPILLDIVGFGIILDRGTSAGTLAAMFGWSSIVFGSLLGGGYLLSRKGTDAAGT
jgi:hypothetical protein